MHVKMEIYFYHTLSQIRVFHWSSRLVHQLDGPGIQPGHAQFP